MDDSGSKQRLAPPGLRRDGRLDSWKEIAAYLNRTPRTVQRWELEESLPIHRLRHEKQGSVYALKDELDQWWESRQDELHTEDIEPTPTARGGKRRVRRVTYRVAPLALVVAYAALGW